MHAAACFKVIHRGAKRSYQKLFKTKSYAAEPCFFVVVVDELSVKKHFAIELFVMLFLFAVRVFASFHVKCASLQHFATSYLICTSVLLSLHLTFFVMLTLRGL